MGFHRPFLFARYPACAHNGQDACACDLPGANAGTQRCQRETPMGLPHGMRIATWWLVKPCPSRAKPAHGAVATD